MRVREVRDGDAEGLVELLGQLGYPVTAEALAARIARNDAPDYRAWVCVADDGRPVGFAGGHVMRPWEQDAPVAQLMILVADEAHRGRGVGSALVDAFEAWARDVGA
ncbi:MAG TPA: GNAT family N-acetyltransferase, partial [Phytomonospora sp.]